MSIHNTYPLSAGHAARLRRQIIIGARNYREKCIIAIFAKLSGSKKYDELVYVSDVMNVYDKDEGLLNQLSDTLQRIFLEIITRP